MWSIPGLLAIIVGPGSPWRLLVGGWPADPADLPFDTRVVRGAVLSRPATV